MDILENLKNLTNQLEQLKASLREECMIISDACEQMSSGEHQEFLIIMREMKEIGDSISAIKENFSGKHIEVVQKLMVADGVMELRREYKGREYKMEFDVKVHVNVTAANKPLAIEWLKSLPEGRELVKEDIHAKTLESFTKEYMTNGNKLPSFFSVFPKPNIAIRLMPKR